MISAFATQPQAVRRTNMTRTPLVPWALAILLLPLASHHALGQVAHSDSCGSATPQMRFRTRSPISSSGPAHFVDSVRVQKGGATVYGHYGLANMGDGVTARLMALEEYLIVEIIPMTGTEIGAITVALQYTAEITGLRQQRYVVVVRDIPPDAFAARAGYKSILDPRTGDEFDVQRHGPW
jgi:hypothetical protein